MNTFFDLFNAKNITGDAELEALVNRARSVLNGKTTEDLKKNKNIRSVVKSEIEGIKTAMKSMVVEKQSRSFDFDE